MINKSLIRNTHRAWNIIYSKHDKSKIPWCFSYPPEWFIDITSQFNLKNKRVLDLGCGLGVYADYLSQRSLEVLGVDFSDDAIRACQNKYKNHNLEFKTCNVLHLDSFLIQNKIPKFNFIIDISLLHHISPLDRKKYVEIISNAAHKDAKLLITCFSDSDPDFAGKKEFLNPDTNTVTHILSKKEIYSIFKGFFKIESLRTVEFGKFSKINKKRTRKRWLILLTKI